MNDVIARLLSIQPMPRGERLAAWRDPRRKYASPRPCLWHMLLIGSHMRHWSSEKIRAYARPLRMARERALAERTRALLMDAGWREVIKARDRTAIVWRDRAIATVMRALRAEARLAALREKVRRRAIVHCLRRVESESTVAARYHVLRSWMERCRKSRRYKEAHAAILAEAARARLALHAAGKGVP